MIGFIESIFTHKYVARWSRGRRGGVILYSSKKPAGSPINRKDAIEEIERIFGKANPDEITYICEVKRV